MVSEAKALADSLGFTSSCTDQVGAVLRLLALGSPNGRIGEIGTGCGVGTAWLASGLRGAATVNTVEIDARRADVVRSLFATSPHVRVVTGDWHELLALGPFDLLFVDGGGAKRDEPQRVVDALAPGGIAVLDDLTPEEYWTAEQRREWSNGDPVREFWLRHPALVAAELGVEANHSILLAARSN